MRIAGGADVGREHAAGLEGAAHSDLGPGGVLARDQLGHGVLEEGGVHAGGADGADLLLVAEEDHAGAAGDGGEIHEGAEAGVGADAVVVAVADNHGAIEAQVARHAGGDELELGGEEVLLGHAVGVGQEAQDVTLDGLLGVLVGRGIGSRADEHVHVLGVEGLGDLLAALLGAEVREDVGDLEDGIAGVVTDGDLDLRAIGLDDDPVEGEGVDQPVKLLDAAVVMGVEVSQAALFAEGDGLEVDARGVGVAADDVDAVGDGLLADDGGHQRLAVVAAIDLVARLQRLEGRELTEAEGLDATHGFGVGTSLGLGDTQIADVILGVIRAGGGFLLGEAAEGVLALHGSNDVTHNANSFSIKSRCGRYP